MLANVVTTIDFMPHDTGAKVLLEMLCPSTPHPSLFQCCIFLSFFLSCKVSLSLTESLREPANLIIILTFYFLPSSVECPESEGKRSRQYASLKLWSKSPTCSIKVQLTGFWRGQISGLKNGTRTV